MILFVRAHALEYDIASDACLANEPELALVQHVGFGSEIDEDLLWQVLSLFLVLGHWGHQQTLWHLPEGKRLTFQQIGRAHV